ncbi:hypothetical protein BDY17DRAFT_84420 [Neohortaea acidophila]|uniref:AA1-like domain-containing protein n=1 Tax=Neohortaea acidophila TaxID=245834 RepID=A0A6A6Q2S0_9PEZI|nr:uncharacterized protein BDY17DRAFT_84420 [Neohortaea acidophila]KAF2486700.1 hypothetical protein BDY17DRAFT_84420 [Neohortaea acidophila]
MKRVSKTGSRSLIYQDMMLSLLAFFGFLLALAGASPASTRDISASTTTTNTPTTPTPCHYKAFDKPWILKDITIFTPSGQGNSSNATAHGTVSFHFCDRNARLLLETDCSGDVIGDACEAGDGGYVSCENANVGFKLASGGVVMVERWYEDNCLGPYPYNSGEAFGQNTTKMSIQQGASGTLASQSELLVEITAMA